MEIERISSTRSAGVFPPSVNETLKIRGGDILLEGSFEYRRKFEKKYGFVFFIDYGDTWNEIKDIRINEVAVAFGTGLRYYSEIAPFRIDFGFKKNSLIQWLFTSELVKHSKKYTIFL